MSEKTTEDMNQELFDHMIEQHGVTLLESEMHDIENIVFSSYERPEFVYAAIEVVDIKYPIARKIFWNKDDAIGFIAEKNGSHESERWQLGEFVVEPRTEI